MREKNKSEKDKFDEVVSRLPLPNLRVLLDAATGAIPAGRRGSREQIEKIKARIAVLSNPEEGQHE